MCYKLGLEVLLEIIHCIFLLQVIYISFLIIFPFLITLLLILSYFGILVDFSLKFKIAKSFLNHSLWLLKIISQK